MKVRLSTVYSCVGFNGVGPLGRLMNKEMPAGASLQVMRNAREIMDVYASVAEQKDKLIEKHGEGEGKDMFIQPDSPNWGGFSSEFSEFLDTEVEMNITMVSADSLKDTPISPVDLEALFFII